MNATNGAEKAPPTAGNNHLFPAGEGLRMVDQAAEKTCHVHVIGDDRTVLGDPRTVWFAGDEQEAGLLLRSMTALAAAQQEYRQHLDVEPVIVCVVDWGLVAGSMADFAAAVEAGHGVNVRFYVAATAGQLPDDVAELFTPAPIPAPVHA